MKDIHPDFLLSNYRFDLPEERIAQVPAARRSDARLMVLDRCGGAPVICRFSDLADHLPENCLLVANNTKVVPARLFGRRPGGGALEMLLLTPLPALLAGASSTPSGSCAAEAEVLARPAARLRPGDTCVFAPELEAEFLERGPSGRCRVKLLWRGALPDILERRGCLPLPPYIRRPGRAARSAGDPAGPSPTSGDALRRMDAERYQTVYAREDKAGSVAAPTAGLHFTADLRERLRASGREWAELTLYVGYGTFSPVRRRDVREHAMHPERAEIPAETAAALRTAAASGRPVIAVGTTSARVLEAVFAGQNPEQVRTSPDDAPGPSSPEMRARTLTACQVPTKAGGPQSPEIYARTLAERREWPEYCIGHDKEMCARTRAERLRAKKRAVFRQFEGDVDIFLYPGKKIHVVDGLITNFHLPESTLLLLVSAMTGRERILAAYREALARGFNFFSYGDAMLIV